MAERRRGSVLIVEDDDSLLCLFEKVLKQAGFEPTPATTVDTAQDFFAQRPFDLMICDLSVAGGRNVFEFVASARAQHPEIAVLIISGYTPEEIAHRAQTINVPILDKPFSPPDLVRRIASILGSQAA